jgi:hypothetical protein
MFIDQFVALSKPADYKVGFLVDNKSYTAIFIEFQFHLRPLRKSRLSGVMVLWLVARQSCGRPEQFVVSRGRPEPPV